MRHLASRSIIATALVFGALGCSDESSDDPRTGGGPLTPGNGGSAGQTATPGGSAGSSPGSAGQASIPGGAGATSAAGAGGAPSGAAGAPSAAGAGGAPPADAGPDSAAPPPPPPPSGPLVALTFDDGPDATATALVLDKLEAHGVPASFFLIGQNIGPDDAAVIQRAIALGCTFENHSQGFASLNTADAATINTSINSTNTAILNATGQNAVFFRPPNLAVSQLMHDTINMPFASGLLGNDFPGGSCGSPPSVQCVTNNILNGVQDGTIILLHDVQPLPHPTPEALDTIIPTLKQRGFEFVNLRELFARRGVDPNSMEGGLWVTVPNNND